MKFKVLTFGMISSKKAEFNCSGLNLNKYLFEDLY